MIFRFKFDFVFSDYWTYIRFYKKLLKREILCNDEVVNFKLFYANVPGNSVFVNKEHQKVSVNDNFCKTHFWEYFTLKIWKMKVRK